MSETDIATGVGITTTQLRAAKSIAKNEQKQAQIGMAQRLKEKGLSNIAIGERMGVNESTVRTLLDPSKKARVDVLQTTAGMLREQVEKKQYIDIGSGVENHIGISSNQLSTAVALLKEEGYTVHYVKVEQLGTGKQTTRKILAAPDTPYMEVFKNQNKISLITDFSDDGGRSFLGLLPPLNIKSKRIGVRYAEQGGAEADGVIYVRRGVEDVSLGSSRYLQVRVAVDGTHYLKGMAFYKDDMPDGVDLIFNTNKSDTGNKLDAMKDLKNDPDNPFGSVVRQRIDLDSKGKPRVTSAMNIVNEEGDWQKWSRSLSTQMLSKQNSALAKAQLAMTAERKIKEFNEIVILTNPAVRKKLLESFSDDVDSSAVHLKAAALPNSAFHVILPVATLKDTEVYAPNYKNGEQVVLIRYPHGGIFEIPQLTVNNNHPESKQLLGGALDAVGINSKVAERLSGADFDGDAVLVIPNGKGQVKTAPALEGLKTFDPKVSYAPYDGMKTMGGGTWDTKTGKEVYPPGKSPSGRTKQLQMGVVSNLITDMSIRGATPTELARAVRHSMVVIDAEKHTLNYKQSAIDNGIKQLKTKYQGGPTAGASTLISRATSEIRVPDRKIHVDKETGEKVYELTGESYVNRKGKLIVKTIPSQKLAETSDAGTLSSGTPIEKVYAEHSNKLKALANNARKEAVNTKSTPYSPSAKAAYPNEVASLKHKLNIALRNRPLERQAQQLAGTVVSAKRQANPDMELSDVKKIKSQALAEARARIGAHKEQIVFTPSEWDAIQAGAISTSQLNQMLNNADLDVVKSLATPREKTVMTTTKLSRARTMLASGYTHAEVAEALGVSVTTLKTSVSE